MHKAGKRGHIKMLEFMLSPTSSQTDRMIIDIQNDFGLTVIEAVNEKIKKNEDAMAAKILQKIPTDLESEKIRKLQQTARYLQKASLGGALSGGPAEEQASQLNVEASV